MLSLYFVEIRLICMEITVKEGSKGRVLASGQQNSSQHGPGIFHAKLELSSEYQKSKNIKNCIIDLYKMHDIHIFHTHTHTHTHIYIHSKDAEK